MAEMNGGLRAGDQVLISGLKARPDLNNSAGRLVKFLTDAGRWAVRPDISNAPADAQLLKIRPENLRPAFRLAKSLSRTDDRSDLHQHLASAMSTQWYAVVDNFLGSEAHARAFCKLMVDLRETFEAGDVAGGRAAAAYARITGQAMPRGDLMKFLSHEEVAKHSALQPVFEELDSAVAALQRAPQLSAEWVPSSSDSSSPPLRQPPPPLRREEMQLTCYPGSGTRYVRHVDNNDGRRAGRRITCILYANTGWQPGDGGELRLHIENTREEEGALAHDVQPLANRLVCFWSDARVPHEVLPSHRDRYALSVWYEQVNDDEASLKQLEASSAGPIANSSSALDVA